MASTVYGANQKISRKVNIIDIFVLSLLKGTEYITMAVMNRPHFRGAQATRQDIGGVSLYSVMQRWKVFANPRSPPSVNR